MTIYPRHWRAYNPPSATTLSSEYTILLDLLLDLLLTIFYLALYVQRFVPLVALPRFYLPFWIPYRLLRSSLHFVLHLHTTLLYPRAFAQQEITLLARDLAPWIAKPPTPLAALAYAILYSYLRTYRTCPADWTAEKCAKSLGATDKFAAMAWVAFAAYPLVLWLVRVGEVKQRYLRVKQMRPRVRVTRQEALLSEWAEVHVDWLGGGA